MAEFKRIDFGSGHAYKVIDSSVQRKVCGLVPRAQLDRLTRPLNALNTMLLSPVEYVCMRKPQGERVILVLTRHNKQNACFLITQRATLLVTLSIKSKELFLENTAFEGYLHESDTQEMTFTLTDVLAMKHIDTSDMDFSVRRAVVCVFSDVVIDRLGKNNILVDFANLVDVEQVGMVGSVGEVMLYFRKSPRDKAEVIFEH